MKTLGSSLDSRTIWPVVRLWRMRFLEDLALPSGVAGPLDLAPFVFEASFCLSVRIRLLSVKRVACEFGAEDGSC